MDTQTSNLFPVQALAPRFVLLVGEALRPQQDVVAEMAQDGLRCLWRANGEQALRTAAIAHFDALCLDSTAMGGSAAWTLTRLREALSCPIAVIGNGLDAQEEITALDHGADLYLARPLPPRRLCAHLLALLRRPRGPVRSERTAAAQTLREHAVTTSSAALLEKLLQAAASPRAGRGLESDLDRSIGAAVSVQANTEPEGFDVYIRGLHLRLR